MKYEITDGEFEMVVDYSVSNNLKSFKEEVLDELYQVHKTHGEMPLLFSGGMDSTFILRSLQTLGISPRIVTFSWTKDNSDFFCNRVMQKCRDYGTKPPEFFYMDKDKLFEHIFFLQKEKGIVYPMLHGFYMDHILNSLEYGGDKFYCGMQGEFKLINREIIMPPAPAIVKKHNPDKLFCFTNDKTFLSYFKHPLFIQNYKKNKILFPEMEPDLWHVRDLIYQACYSDMKKQKKFPRDPCCDYITHPFYKWAIKEVVSSKYFQMPPCVFDAKFLIEV